MRPCDARSASWDGPQRGTLEASTRTPEQPAEQFSGHLLDVSRPARSRPWPDRPRAPHLHLLLVDAETSRTGLLQPPASVTVVDEQRWTSACDEKGYIVPPGLGDAADRLRPRRVTVVCWSWAPFSAGSHEFDGQMRGTPSEIRSLVASSGWCSPYDEQRTTIPIRRGDPALTAHVAPVYWSKLHVEAPVYLDTDTCPSPRCHSQSVNRTLPWESRRVQTPCWSTDPYSVQARLTSTSARPPPLMLASRLRNSLARRSGLDPSRSLSAIAADHCTASHFPEPRVGGAPVAPVGPYRTAGIAGSTTVQRGR